MNRVNIVSQFVDLILRYKQWNEIRGLPNDEVQILFEIVKAAGFGPKEIVFGKLVGYYRDQDGSRTGETYPINSLCPFKVVSQENDDDYPSTGWLDCAFRRVVVGATQQEENRDQLIKIITAETEQSVPLQPIQLTPEGDLLCEYPPQGNGFGVKHTRDDHGLNTCVGVHKYCHGWMDRIRATETHDVIFCRRCNLRVIFPKNIKTYGELRQYLCLSAQRVPTQCVQTPV